MSHAKVNKRTAETEKLFRHLLMQQGARPADGARWRGTKVGFDIVCRVGHARSPRPQSVLAGKGVCGICAGRDTHAAHQQFLQRVLAHGARPADNAVWRGKDEPYELVCAQGHPCSPRPGNVRACQGLCLVCARQDPATAHTAFLLAATAQGASPTVGAQWRGNDGPYPLICRKGHDCSPQPASVLRGQGVCKRCAGLDSDVVHADYVVLINALGATIAPGSEWIGVMKPYALICARGHRCVPRPNSVISGGQGLCDECDTRFDRVYLLRHAASGAVKIGVASGAARVRGHESRGYELAEQWTGRDHATVRDVERTVLGWWRAQGAPMVPAAPMDGRTETAPELWSAPTLEKLTGLLGDADAAEQDQAA